MNIVPCITSAFYITRSYNYCHSSFIHFQTTLKHRINILLLLYNIIHTTQQQQNIHTMNQSENLYDKLNNVHASLRKQKEDAFRTKQLAEQRLAIQKQDREGVEKKGADTRAKLRTLKERTVEMKNVNGVNEAENKQFEKEVRNLC